MNNTMGGRGSSGGNAPTSGKKEVTVSDLSKASKEWSRTHVYGTKATAKETSIKFVASAVASETS